ncbi:protein of unknown function [Pseudomonas inefficax]|uniref:Uncharacterized protein n=1 Tax=Pseudomonas inefficax TaxID=2078786 RepID=A0AAQ1P9U6_9PSED|nr:protein of unknown function [Pseudomonas inefficax]
MGAQGASADGSWTAPCSIRGGMGASSVMRDQRRTNEIDSQVLIPQSFVMSVHALKHLCYHARHHDLH